jgi:hypothetical protein
MFDVKIRHNSQRVFAAQEKPGMTVRERLLLAIEQAPETLLEELLSICDHANRPTIEATVVTQPEALVSDLDIFFQSIDKIRENIPANPLDTNPTDMAVNHDHYLYGSPKAEP